MDSSYCHDKYDSIMISDSDSYNEEDLYQCFFDKAAIPNNANECRKLMAYSRPQMKATDAVTIGAQQFSDGQFDNADTDIYAFMKANFK